MQKIPKAGNLQALELDNNLNEWTPAPKPINPHSLCRSLKFSKKHDLKFFGWPEICYTSINFTMSGNLPEVHVENKILLKSMTSSTLGVIFIGCLERLSDLRRECARGTTIRLMNDFGDFYI